MNDGVTRALLNTGLLSSGQQSQPQIKLLELPAALQKQSVISGEVVKTDHGEVTLKTPQGNVVFEADVNVAVGQKITLKLQIVVQNAQRNLSVELTSISGNPPAKPAASQVPVQTTGPLPSATTPTKPETTQSQQPSSPVATQAPVRTEALPVLADDPSAQFPLLQAKVIDLPKIVSQEALFVLVKEILNLPQQKALPPTLQEGLNKVSQILPLVAQFSANGVPTILPASDISEQQIVLSLLQLIQGTANTSQKNETALSAWPIQNLPLLQSINPGEKITKDLLTNLITQLQTAIPKDQEPGITQPTPLTALVLGQKATPSLPIGVVPTLVLSMQPDGQQALIFITATQKSPLMPALLPGTVIVMNAPPTQVEPIAIPFSTLLNATAAAPLLLPLHPSIGDTWPALQDVWNDILSQQLIAPDAAAALKQTIPMPMTQQMPPSVLLFMAALQLGTPDAWLGSNILDKLQSLEKSSLINQLTRDMQAIRGAMQDTGPVDMWRPLPIPLQVGNELVRMQWFYRHQYDDLPKGYTSEEEAESKKRRKTRFILDVPQTRLGDIQIDGLMQERNLDLILRTESTLASFMETAIRGRYTQSLETAGIVGGISFQAGKHQYVQV